MVRNRGERPRCVRKEPDPSLTTRGAKKTARAAEEAEPGWFLPHGCYTPLPCYRSETTSFPLIPLSLPTTGPFRPNQGEIKSEWSAILA